MGLHLLFFFRGGKKKTFQKLKEQEPIWEESAAPDWCEVAKNDFRHPASLYQQFFPVDLHFNNFFFQEHNQSCWYCTMDMQNCDTSKKEQIIQAPN